MQSNVIDRNDYGPYTLRKRFRHEEEYTRIPKKQSWRKNILNLDEHTILGRTCTSWIAITIFIIIFYTLLGLFWNLNFTNYQHQVDYHRPAVLMTQPGFSFQPCTSIETHRSIEYSEKVADEMAPYIAALTNSIKKYNNKSFDYFTPCTPANKFGFPAGTPCILLKINKAIGFEVDTYQKSSELPKMAPKELKSYMSTLSENDRKRKIWVSCQTRNKSTVTFKYYPKQWVEAQVVEVPPMAIKMVMNSQFYNDTDQKRMVAIQLSNLQYNQRITVKCHIWAKNIRIDNVGDMGVGLVRFQMKVTKT